jgi:phenylalanyl-tRNA synthetase beta chain
MKVVYEHLINFIPSKPSIDDISQKFFQLGHEHEVQNNIFDMELTPNRGDCLSINGLLRDLAVFYEIKLSDQFYENDIKSLDIDFINKAQEACPYISFLKIEIEEKIHPYKGVLKKYFDDLGISRNNFFTDISNYISYETGQPTHCYDSKKIKGTFSLENTKDNYVFETLMNKKIKLQGQNLVFIQDNNTVINLAGVMGGINTSCSSDTKSVIIECAYFSPEKIIGKSLQYDIKSDAAHKFERGVDPLCHEKVLRRFLEIVSEHTCITNVEIIKKEYQEYKPTQIPLKLERVNKILGTSLVRREFEEYLLKLGFVIKDNTIISPSYRADIQTQNDLAEEIARVIGYDNIPIQSYKIPELINLDKESALFEASIKNLLTQHGFFEVINNPFTSSSINNSVKVDNPLDSNKEYLRTSLEKSLTDNLLYNEKRQQDSIKLFEISDIYYFEEEVKNKKMLGIICSGRVGKNYLDFSKTIDIKFLKSILNKAFPKIDLNPVYINRDLLESKSKNNIAYLEIEMKNTNGHDYDFVNHQDKKLNKNNFIKYSPISPFPCSVRDLSFALKDKEEYFELQDFLLNYNEEIIKEIYIFDFYNNKINDEIKIGFRFIFQSKNSTITELEVSNVMNQIIEATLSKYSVHIPGFK